MQPNYDHSYYFISTFMSDHLIWHREELNYFCGIEYVSEAWATGSSISSE